MAAPKTTETRCRDGSMQRWRCASTVGMAVLKITETRCRDGSVPSLSKAQEVRTLACVNEQRREFNMIGSTHLMKIYYA